MDTEFYNGTSTESSPGVAHGSIWAAARMPSAGHSCGNPSKLGGWTIGQCRKSVEGRFPATGRPVSQNGAAKRGQFLLPVLAESSHRGRSSSLWASRRESGRSVTNERLGRRLCDVQFPGRYVPTGSTVISPKVNRLCVSGFVDQKVGSDEIPIGNSSRGISSSSFAQLGWMSKKSQRLRDAVACRSTLNTPSAV